MKRKQQKISTIEDLATLMQGEFLVMHDKFAEVHEKMDTGFCTVYERFDSFEVEMKQLRSDLEDLRLRMDQAAYHFEIQDIEKRLRRLELRFAKK